LRSKIKAASYTGTKGRQLEELFQRLDKDRSGQLDEQEVRRAFRRTLRIPESIVSDFEISSFCALLDADGMGSISIDEIVAFVGEDEAEAKHTRNSRWVKTRHNPSREDWSPSSSRQATPRMRRRPAHENNELLNRIRSRLKASASTHHTGRPLGELFGRFDKHDSGKLSEQDVCKVLRCIFRIPARIVSDAEITILCKFLSSQNAGEVAISAFADFVQNELDIAKPTEVPLKELRAKENIAPLPQIGSNPARGAYETRLPIICKPLDPCQLGNLCKLRPIIKSAMDVNSAYAGWDGGQLQTLLKRHDKDGSDSLEYAIVSDALRCALRIPASVVSDLEINEMCIALDADNSGAVSISRFLAYINSNENTLRRDARQPPPLLQDVVQKVKSAIKSAAYTPHSGRQLDVLFSRFDTDKSGFLCDREVRRALRRTLRIPPSVMSDLEISSLCALLDGDNSGHVSICELVDFVGPEPEVSKRTGRALPMGASVH